MKMKPNELIAQAKLAAEKAYAPYSKFRVGAALLAASGEVFCGANVENASYGLTICAERAAVACGVSAGARKFTALALFSPDADQPLYPCGACLQVLAEFAEEMKIYTQDGSGKILRTTLKVLLPKAFRK
jgi:cytidine deaminase